MPSTRQARSQRYTIINIITAFCIVSPLPVMPFSYQNFALHIDEATVLTSGGERLPPMSSVPCSGILNEIVKPPSVDELYEWYLTRNMPDADPSWGALWPTAVKLSDYLVENPHLVEGKKVVELGSGLALCGLTSVALGADSVVISDREPFALHCALSTAACNRNIDCSNIKATLLDWTADNNDMVNSADLIIASDVLYDKKTVEAFGSVCKRIAAVNGCTLLVADPKVERTPGARETLREALKKDFDIIETKVIATEHPSHTVDGKDHDRRMLEPTLIIKCNL